MAKPRQPDAVTPVEGRRQTRGPLGPGTPEVSIFASLEDGAVAATPPDMTHRGRKTGILVTDDPSCAERFSHATVEPVGARPPRIAMLEATFAARRLEYEERVILVAGSAGLVKAALDDSWRVVIRCDADAAAPHALAEWRTSRPKGSDATTYTRD